MKKLLCFLGLLIFLVGCTPNENVENIDNTDKTVEEENEVKLTPEEIIEQYKPNEIGDIPVLMYHAIQNNPPTEYQRGIDDFKKDLQYFYDNNYRPISMQDFVNFNITTPPGTTPFVLCFDDGLSESFSLVEENGVFVPKKDTGIYILEEFVREHPDFGKAAILYINGHTSTFDGAGTYTQRLNWLVDHGYELGNHLDTHPYLNRIGGEQITKEVGKVDKMIKEAVPGIKLDTIAYPFGIKPSDENIRYIQNGVYDGNEYAYVMAFRAGPSTVRQMPVIHVDFMPWNVPRLRGNEGEENGADLWGYLKKYETRPEQRYISDGDPKTVTIPETLEKNINVEKIGDKKIITY